MFVSYEWNQKTESHVSFADAARDEREANMISEAAFHPVSEPIA